ncbi:glycosyltransferase family 87 protein [Longispora fulva]|uniref:Putative membrane protein n=1 Tax=Longispora fulva TaxID=619741 RepID=A0A8J7GL30_9ACTN|nr:glycosyltransferase 87 family protein [Longispora fulva]MBG6139660.1 putative membrane protein [Longispora fulva]
MRDDDHTTVSPARTDWFVRGLSQVIGGPRGGHATARPGRFWTPVRVVLALACLVIALNWLQKSPCMDGAWADNVQYKKGCYTDVLALYYAEHLSDGMIPYVDFPVEYPVLTGAFMGVLGLPVHALGVKNPALNQAMLFYNVNAVVLGILGVATVGILLALRRRRPWDAALLACAPAMLVTATVNWDLLVLCLAAASMLFWARRKPVWAGVFLGLAVAAKFYPLLMVGPLLLLVLRTLRTPPKADSDGPGGGSRLAAFWAHNPPLRHALTTISVALLTWAAINGPVWLFWRESWNRFWDLNSTRGVDWGTLWYIGAHFPLGGDRYGIPFFQNIAGNVDTLNTAYLLLFVICCGGVAVLTFMAPRRPRLAALAFLVLAAFLLTGKVWSQQYVLWLIPLAVLARPRWGAFLAWQAAEIGYFIAFYGELLGASGGKQAFPEWVFVTASGLRLGTLAVLCGFVVRDILKPREDIVRDTYADDPDGGVLDGAEDATWVTRLAGPGGLQREDDRVAVFAPVDPELVARSAGGALPGGAGNPVA